MGLISTSLVLSIQYLPLLAMNVSVNLTRILCAIRTIVGLFVPYQPGNDVSQRINRARHFIRAASNTLNRTEVILYILFFYNIVLYAAVCPHIVVPRLSRSSSNGIKGHSVYRTTGINNLININPNDYYNPVAYASDHDVTDVISVMSVVCLSYRSVVSEHARELYLDYNRD